MSRTPPAPPDWPRGVRGVRMLLATSDPGLARLRSAVGKVVVIASTAAVVVVASLLVGGPVSAAVTGVVVAFVTSVGLRDGASADVVSTIAWTAVAVSAVAVLSSVVGNPASAAGVAAFIGLGIGVVFLQRLGPAGFAPGLAGFLGFLATSLTGLTPGDLPLAVGSTLLAALTVVATRSLTRPRRPERTARKVLEALETRAGLAVVALGDLVREERSDRARRRARRRFSALRRTAGAADDHLGATDVPVVAGTDNLSLGVRVFDLRLGLEHLAGLLDDPGPSSTGRIDLADLLDDVGRALLAPADHGRRWEHVDARLAETGPTSQVRVRRTLGRTVADWRRPADRLDDDPPTDPDEPATPGASGGDVGSPPLSDTLRRAVQVALTIGLAALAGQWISPSQWFFCVVIAFVAFVTSSSRGAVLGEGLRRTLGTVVGVVAGVALASLLGGNPVATVAVAALCLVGLLYAAGVSSTALMFFVTVALALVYELLGRFTVDVLLIRLAETAAGAAIGVTVSFFVLPIRTRTTFGDATARFLRAVHRIVDESVTALTCDTRATATVQTVDGGSAQELRDAYADVETAAGPLTDGPAGFLHRIGHRDGLRVVGSCDHHARVLLRLGRRHGAVLGDDPAAARSLRDAAAHVTGRAEALARRLDRQLDDDGGASAGADDTGEHGRLLGALDDAAQRLDHGSPGPYPEADRLSPGDVLETVGARLRAIDRALTDMSDRR